MEGEVKKEKKAYRVKPGYEGLTAWTVAPEYARKDGGKFLLDDSISQKDLGYLYEVIHYEGVEKVG